MEPAGGCHSPWTLQGTPPPPHLGYVKGLNVLPVLSQEQGDVPVDLVLQILPGQQDVQHWPQGLEDSQFDLSREEYGVTAGSVPCGSVTQRYSLDPVLLLPALAEAPRGVGTSLRHRETSLASRFVDLHGHWPRNPGS